MTSPGAADGLTVGLWQCDGPLLDVEGALRALEVAAAEAAARGVRLLVCPELTLTGYDVADQEARLAEPADGPMAAAVADIARRHDLAIVWSWPELTTAAGVDRVHIAAQVVERDGTVLATHTKAHLFGPDEEGAYVPADPTCSPAIAELDGFRVGLAICYDVEFPELVRLVALAGADLVACPTALMTPYERVATLLVPARAYENQVAVAYANRCGTENDLTYTGLSCLVGPDGADIARAGTTPTLAVGRLTRTALDEGRRANSHLSDRRPELYAGLTQPRSHA
jgi:predicted amidohydrolase